MFTLRSPEKPSWTVHGPKTAPNPYHGLMPPPADHSTPVTVAPVPPCVHPPATPQTARYPTIFGLSWDQDQCPDDSPPYVRPGASASSRMRGSATAAEAGVLGSMPKSNASLRAASRGDKLNSLAAKSITSPVA